MKNSEAIDANDGFEFGNEEDKQSDNDFHHHSAGDIDEIYAGIKLS